MIYLPIRLVLYMIFNNISFMSSSQHRKEGNRAEPRNNSQPFTGCIPGTKNLNKNIFGMHTYFVIVIQSV